MNYTASGATASGAAAAGWWATTSNDPWFWALMGVLALGTSGLAVWGIRRRRREHRQATGR